VAPVQAVIVPIPAANWKETVLPVAQQVRDTLRAAGLRVDLDAREEFTPGWKFSEYEMRGVPVRIEIGPRDVKAGQAVLVRRDLKSKETASLESLATRLPALLDEIQAELYRQAGEFVQANTRTASTYEEFKEILDSKRGFIQAPWCGGEACEDRIKTETMATIRVLPLALDDVPVTGGCVCCGAPGKATALFARAY
jgi:prolyl-tRNA synthetase